MRIDMIYYPNDFFSDAPGDVDVEASGRTFTALLTKALAEEFPDARVNVWYNPTEVRSSQEFEIHWDEGEVTNSERRAREREIRDRVADLAGRIREGQDWIVRIA